MYFLYNNKNIVVAIYKLFECDVKLPFCGAATIIFVFCVANASSSSSGSRSRQGNTQDTVYLNDMMILHQLI